MTSSTIHCTARRRRVMIERCALAITLCCVATAAPAQKLLGLRLDRTLLVPGQWVELSLEIDLGPRNRCGVHLNFGDNDERDINAEHVVEQQYKKFDRPGRYVIRAVGKFLNRGLLSPEACTSTVSAVVDVSDPAVQTSQDVERETRLKQREDALEGRVSALRAQEGQAAQRQRQVEAKLDEATKKLDERERRLVVREAQVIVRSPVPAPEPVPKRPAEPAPKRPAEPVKAPAPPKDDSLKVWK